MGGMSPQLPLHPDSLDGYALNKNYRDMIQQNFKCLLLTNPGERIMEPEFGVGLSRYLFEMNDATTYGSVVSKIEEQIEIYMPFIRIINVLARSGDGTNLDPSTSNTMNLKIHYEILPLGISDIIEIIDNLA
tara:strand:- start:318 stop:713 length:396 start_codon:yes stop_codon:yes gene_type:complete